ncbi:MAG: hypothetical protein KBS45_00250, partial [Clostridiales bacterium]|nr:hypothetical protein [Candidatus Coliplasma caballi]
PRPSFFVLPPTRTPPFLLFFYYNGKKRLCQPKKIRLRAEKRLIFGIKSVILNKTEETEK